MNNKFETLFNNLENGNLEDAKKQAKTISFQILNDGFLEKGYSLMKTKYAITFLRCNKNWQEYCDCKS